MGRRRRGTWRRFPASSLGPTNERSEAKRGVLEASWWLGGLSPASPCLRTEGRGAKVRHHLTESTAYKQDILYLLWPVRMVSRAPGGALYCNSQNECLVSREGGASRKRIGRMRLTTFTDYCLRVLMFVGAKEGETSTIEEIAGSYGISRNHLMKVVFRLGQLGYLTNVRGKGGGIYLAAKPERINIGALIRQTEEDLAIVECFGQSATDCRIESACILRQALGKALNAFLAVLDSYTLADLLAPRRKLSQILNIPAPARLGKKAS
jgi:Rrf2 family transcriptional regulator, nitric oxide-sensitive transcriptional repressor